MTMAASTSTTPDPIAGARRAVAEHRFSILLGGEPVTGDREMFVAEDPTTESELARFPLANNEDVDRAVMIAQDASRSWGRIHWTDRAAALHDLAAAIEANADELGRLDTFDAGLPIRTATKDAHDAARSLRYFAGLGGEITGRAHPWSPGSPFMHTSREPYGVVGKIVPFNHPLKFAAVKAAAPLIAGNSVIIKPSEFTSLSALRLAELASEVLPSGVFTVLPGRGDVGAAMAAHPGIPRLSFTGSVTTGAHVMRGSAAQIKHVTMELGGKNPMIVFPDADPIEAARAAVASLDLFRSPGQACWSTSRVLLHDDIREPFLEELVATIEGIRIGDPADPTIDIGPLAYRGHFERVSELVASGVAEGARVLIGGSRPPNTPTGFYLEPTVFVDVTPSMRIAHEEVFGPVMSVLSWTDSDDVVGLANSTRFGLTASVWSADAGRAQSVARQLDAGVVWVNTASARPVGMPFGGYKQSGVGKEGNLEEILSYTQEKAIISRTDAIGGGEDE